MTTIIVVKCVNQSMTYIRVLKIEETEEKKLAISPDTRSIDIGKSCSKWINYYIELNLFVIDR